MSNLQAPKSHQPAENFRIEGAKPPKNKRKAKRPRGNQVNDAKTTFCEDHPPVNSHVFMGINIKNQTETERQGRERGAMTLSPELLK